MTRREPKYAFEDMRDYAREAVELCAGRSRSDLDTNRPFRHAITRLLEIVGEAATRVPAEMRSSHPQLPWRDIVGMRNRVIHGYDNVDHDRVWLVVHQELPPLITQIEEILSRWDETPPPGRQA